MADKQNYLTSFGDSNSDNTNIVNEINTTDGEIDYSVNIDFTAFDESVGKLSEMGLVKSVRDDSGNFVRGVKGQFSNLKPTAKSAVAASVEDEALMNDSLLDQQYTQRRYELDEPDIFEVDSISGLKDYVAGMAGQAVGSVAQMVGGGGLLGVGAKAYAKNKSKKALDALAKKQGADSSADDIGNVVGRAVQEKGFVEARDALSEAGARGIARAQTGGMGAGAFATTFPQQMGDTASNIYSETGELEGGVAAVTALAQSSLEIMPLMREFKRIGVADKMRGAITKKIAESPTRIRQILRTTGGTALFEGATEATQAVIGQVALEVVNEEKDHFAVADVKAIVNQMLGGAVGGALMGGPRATIEAYKSDKPWFKQHTQRIKDLEDDYVKASEIGDEDAKTAIKETYKAEQAAAEAQQVQDDQEEQAQTQLNDAVSALRQVPDGFRDWPVERLKPVVDAAVAQIESEIAQNPTVDDTLKQRLGEVERLRDMLKPAPVDSIQKNTENVVDLQPRQNELSGMNVIDTNTGEIIPVEKKQTRADEIRVAVENNESENVDLLTTPSIETVDGGAPQASAQEFIEDGSTAPFDETEANYFDFLSEGDDGDNKSVPLDEEDLSKVGDLGGGISNSLYEGLFNSLQKGTTKFSGITDPVLVQALPLYKNGKIKTVADLRDYVQTEYNGSNQQSVSAEEKKLDTVDTFIPTHQFPDGTEVKQVPDEDNVFVDVDGNYFEDDEQEVVLITGDRFNGIAIDKPKAPEATVSKKEIVEKPPKSRGVSFYSKESNDLETKIMDIESDVIKGNLDNINGQSQIKILREKQTIVEEERKKALTNLANKNKGKLSKNWIESLLSSGFSDTEINEIANSDLSGEDLTNLKYEKDFGEKFKSSSMNDIKAEEKAWKKFVAYRNKIKKPFRVIGDTFESQKQLIGKRPEEQMEFVNQTILAGSLDIIPRLLTDEEIKTLKPVKETEYDGSVILNTKDKPYANKKVTDKAISVRTDLGEGEFEAVKIKGGWGIKETDSSSSNKSDKKPSQVVDKKETTRSVENGITFTDVANQLINKEWPNALELLTAMRDKKPKEFNALLKDGGSTIALRELAESFKNTTLYNGKGSKTRKPLSFENDVQAIDAAILGAVEAKSNDTRFSREPSQVQSLTQPQVDAIVKGITARWGGDTDVTVIANASAIDAAVKKTAQEQGATLDEINAYVHKDKITIVADKMDSARKIEETLFHEAYGHLGLRKLFGDDLHKALNGMWSGIGGSKGFNDLVKKYGLESRIEPYKKSAGTLMPENRNAMLMDELLAHIAQFETGTLKQKAKELLGMLRDWLRKSGFVTLDKLNDSDLAYVLRQSREAVLAGRGKAKTKVSVEPAFSREPKQTDDSDDLFAGIGDNDIAVDAKSKAKDLLGRSYQWVKDNAREIVKNGGLGALTLDQLAEISEKSVPKAKEYAVLAEDMFTDRHTMQNESAELGARWNKQSELEKRKIAVVMHESTKLGVDPSFEKFQATKVLVTGGMKAVRVSLGLEQNTGKPKELDKEPVAATVENRKLLKQRMEVMGKRLRGARTVEAKAVAQDLHNNAIKEYREMRNAVKRDVRNVKSFPRLRSAYLRLNKESKAIYVDARDAYLERSQQMEDALKDEIKGMRERQEVNKKQAGMAMKILREGFEAARLQGVYFPLYRDGSYFVRALKKRTDIKGTKLKTYLKNPGRIDEATNKGTGETYYTIGNRRFDTLEQAEQGNKVWGSKASALASSKERADLIGERLEAVEVGKDEWVLRDSEYELEFSLYKTANEAKREAEKRDNDPNYKEVKTGTQDEIQTQDDFAVSGSFLASAFDVLDKGNVNEDIKDDLYQAYLKTLPQLSQRKHFIHRKGIAGNSDEALTAYSHSMTHLAHQISKLRYQPKLKAKLEDIAEDVKAIDDPDTALFAGNVRNEIRRRHDWVINPQNGKIVNHASGFGFFMYLGVSPAAAAVNLSQTAIVGYPTLAAEYGWKKAGQVLLKTASEMSAIESLFGDKSISRGNTVKVTMLGKEYELNTKDSSLKKTEVQALADAVDRGYIDVSQAHSLMSMTDNDSLQSSITYQKWMGRVGHLFHKAEVMNREVTFLAGYRMARDSGKSHDDAVMHSGELTKTSHFNYANYNRSKWMQSDGAKILLMFKSYSQHMIYYLMRNAHAWGKGGAEGKKAQVRLLGILGTTMALGGVSALPIGIMGGVGAGVYAAGRVGTKKAVAGSAGVTALIALASLLWDDDEPFDWETEVRAELRRMGGDTLETLVFRGLGNTVLGIDLSGRVSLDDLLIRKPNRELEGRDQGTHLAEQLMGPVVGYGLNTVFTAKQLWDEDHGYRALEKLSPKFARDTLKALRYSNEGAKNLRGSKVVDSDLLSLPYGEDLNWFNVLWQAQGFTPEKLTRQYIKTNDVKNYETQINRRKQQILSRHWIALKEKDADAMKDTLKAAEKWNKANPKEPPIDAKKIEQSMKARMRADKNSINGVNLRKSARYLVGELGVE